MNVVVLLGATRPAGRRLFVVPDLLIYNENENRPRRIRGQSQCCVPWRFALFLACFAVHAQDTREKALARFSRPPTTDEQDLDVYFV
jgi:hypothetical protein